MLVGRFPYHTLSGIIKNSGQFSMQVVCNTYYPYILFTGFGGSANKSSPLHTSPPPKRNNSPDGPSPAEPITDVSKFINYYLNFQNRV